MVTKAELFESPDISPLDFYLWDWMKGEVYKRKVDTPDKPLAGILDAAACVKKRVAQHRRKTRDLWKRTAKCIEVAGVICEHSL